MLIGANIDPQHRFSKRGIDDLGPQIVRFPLRYGRDCWPFFQWCQSLGYEPLPIVTNETFTARELQKKWWLRGLERVRREYPTLKQIQIGNEPDQPNSPSSWYMEKDDYNALIAAARAVWENGNNVTIVGAGLVSGDARWIVGASRADTVSIHPYGKNPTTVVGLIREYQALTSLPIWVTELGAEHGAFNDEHERAVWHTGMLKTLDWLGVRATCVFCYSDRMVPQFGLLDGGGRPYESYAAVKDAISP